jgi:hypothetical protein
VVSQALDSLLNLRNLLLEPLVPLEEFNNPQLLRNLVDLDLDLDYNRLLCQLLQQVEGFLPLDSQRLLLLKEVCRLEEVLDSKHNLPLEVLEVAFLGLGNHRRKCPRSLLLGDFKDLGKHPRHNLL